MATIVITLVACGGTTNTNDTSKSDASENNQTTNKDTQQQEEPSSENGIFSEDFSLEFPDGMDGYTHKCIYTEDETWSYNETHYKDERGLVVDFKWEGPSEIGEEVNKNEFTLSLNDISHNYILRASRDGNNMNPDQIKAAISYFDKDSITTSDNNDGISYINGGFYNQATSDTKGVYTYAVSGEIDGVMYKGYNKLIIGVEKGCGYVFTYLEKESTYNDERAYKVIDSIDFWNMETVEWSDFIGSH